MKTCSKCKTEKLLDMFGKDKKRKDGLCPTCKLCRAAYHAENSEIIKVRSALYYAVNANMFKAKAAIYRAEHKESVRALNVIYRRENKEKLKALSIIYRKENAVSVAATNLAWQRANTDKTREYNHNHRSSKVINGGKLSNGLAGRLFKLQRGLCPCCKQPLGDDYHMDHKMPLKLGGSNTDDNIQLLRRMCNSQKKAMHPVEFMQSRGFLL